MIHKLFLWIWVQCELTEALKHLLWKRISRNVWVKMIFFSSLWKITILITHNNNRKCLKASIQLLRKFIRSQVFSLQLQQWVVGNHAQPFASYCSRRNKTHPWRKRQQPQPWQRPGWGTYLQNTILYNSVFFDGGEIYSWFLKSATVPF